MSRENRARARRLAVALLPAALLLGTACVEVPQLDDALARSSVAQTTKVYAADGSLIAELHAEEDREVIPLAAVPPLVRDAILAIEDARFYSHSGIDAVAVARALARNANEGRVVEGGSTITQQLVKNTLVTSERTVERKLKEAILALQLEERFTKDEILERYLNTVYFGRGAYGIQAAARTFFRKRPKQLTLPEAAFLAGMIRSPSVYDPAKDPARARNRRNTVLRRMLEEGMIDSDAFEEARRSKLRLRPQRERRHRYPYFVEYVKERIFDGDEEFAMLGETREDRINAVFKGGLRIYTTIDPKLQEHAEKAVRTVLPYESDPRTGFVAMRPGDGSIVAMVGGRNFYSERDPYAKLNLTLTRRQPGSAFKPFTLIAALERGIPLTRVYRGGSRVTLRLPGGEIWSPGNYENTNPGSSVSLLRATALSVNVVYAQVALQVGADTIVRVAKRMGISSKLDAVYSISLGTQEVSVLELARAYASLANGGYRVPPTAITAITDARGTMLYKPSGERSRVLSEQVVALTTKALQEVMRTGTGRGVALRGRPSAGKTGTSEEYADAWFAGYTPQMVGVTWVGFPRARIPMRPPRTRMTVYGGRFPGQIWNRFMEAAHRGLAEEEFKTSNELLVDVRIDVSRGCVPNRFTPPYLIETRSFVKGSEPTERCTHPTSGDIRSTPGVVGLRLDDARRLLEHAGYAVTVERAPCLAFRRGTVCDQDPPPGSSGTVGDPATITVAEGAPVLVPSVHGLDEDRARQKLKDAGLRVRVVRRENPASATGCSRTLDRRDGVVWYQSVCEGVQVNRGTVVTVYVNP